MPTIQQIEQAMIAADRAGDTAAAQILAEEIRRLMEEAQPRKRGIGAAFQRGLESQLSAGRTGAGVYTGSPEEAARAGLARQEDIGRRYEDEIGLERLKRAYEEKGLLAAGKELGRQIPLALAEQAPQIAATLGSARIGSMAGAPLGPAGVIGGGLLGATVPSFLMASGAQAERRAQEQVARGEPVSIDRGALAATAAPSAALDVAATLIPLGKTAVSKVTGIPLQAFSGRTAAQAEKLANERLLATLTKGTATGVAVEVPTEILQQMLERAQAGLPLASPDAYAEYGDTAYRVSLLGPLGAVGRLSEKGAARDELAAQQAAPAVIAPAEAPITQAAPAAAEIPIEERRFRDITPVPGAPTPAAERRFTDITPVPTAPTAPVAPEKVDIFKMMESHDTLKSSLDPLADRIEKARQEGDAETARALMQEYRDNEAAMNALATQITEAGGVLESAEEAEAAYNKQLKTLDSKIAKEENTIREMSRADVRDYDAVDKAEKRLAKLQAERSAAEEEFQRKRGVFRVKETPPGQQISLFDTEEQKPRAEEVLQFKTETGQELTGPELERMSQGPMRPDQDYLSQQAVVAAKQRGKVLEKYQEELAELVNKDTRQMTPDVRNNHDEQMHQALMKVRQLENEVAALKQGQSTAALKAAKNEAFGADSLFGNFNILNTAIQNQDQRTIDRIAELRRKADLAAFGHQHYKISPREEVYQMLKDRIGGILRRERNYDSYEATVNDQRVEIYVSDAIAKEIVALRRKVEAPRTRTVNGKKVPVRSMLQMLYDYYDDYNVRVAKLEKAKADKADKKTIAAKKAAVERAKEKYQKQFNAVMVERNKLDVLLRGMYKTTGEFAPAPGTKGEPTIKTPRQKQEELEKLGKSRRETSKEVKVAQRVSEGKVKISEAKVAQELGETMDEYQTFAAPYQKRLQTKVEQYNKFIANANARLNKLKEKYIDAAEVAAVEQQLKAAKAELKAVPDENPIEKDKAQKKVSSLEAQLVNVKIPKEKKYKIAEANLVKIAKERLDELNKLKDELTKLVGAKAVELGKQHPDFKKRLTEAKEEYQEALQDSVQEVKNLRTPQVTRKLPKLKETRTASEESRAETQRRQAAFESELSEEKGASYEYQQREEARERTLRARQAKEAKGTAMQVAMTKAAQQKVLAEVEAREKEQGKFLPGVETESKDLTTDQVKLLEENKLRDAYRNISEDETNQPLNRAVALALEVYADKTDVVIRDQLFAPDGQEAMGLATARKVEISRKYGLTQEVLLHEGTHSAVERTIQIAEEDITQLGKEEQAAYRELVALYNAAKNDPAITSKNAKSSVSEFAAEVMSNENLQKQLRQKKWRVSDAFRGFVSIILRMIGVKNVNNMLDASVAAVEALMLPTSLGQQAIEQQRAKPLEDVGVVNKGKGVFGFNSQTQPTQFASSFVAKEKGKIDTLRGNMLGLSGRVQFVDQYAALSEALRKGVDSNVVKDLEAEQAEYFLRFGQQRTQFATQFVTNGPVKLVGQDTKRGKEFTYQSTPGANLTKIATTLEQSGMGNGTQLEAMFTAYLAGKRAKQVGWNKLNISDPALAEREYNEVLAVLNANPKGKAAFEEAAKIYKEYNAGLLDFLVQTGYMSGEKAAELKAIDYVPYYRVKGGELQLLVDKEHPIRIANIKDQPELHSLVGDNAQIMPFFTSAIQNTFILTNMGLRNQSVKDTSFLLKRMGIASKVGEGSGPSSPDTVRFKVKGKDYFATIDTDDYGIPAELIVKGMEGIKTTIPAAVRLMGLPADWLRTFVTRNPTYAIRQAIRDPLTAYMTTGMDGIPVLNSMKELSKMVAGRSEEERKLMAGGAISSNVLTGDEKDMEKALREISLGKTGWTKLMAKADAFAMQGDAATRAAIYKDSIDKGMSDMQAYLRTLESMNFSRRGLSPSMQMLSTLIPFFNAQIQGLDVMYRTFTGKYGGMPYHKQLEIRKKMWMRGSLIALATMAYAMTMEDDEAYKRAKPEERLGNWFVYTPFADEPVRVPIPFEFGYLFKSLPEAVYNLAAKDERNDDITKGMGKLLGLSNPFALPAAVKPVTEVILGKSFFGGDIESMREQQTMLPTERYRASTTEVSKLIGSLTGDAGLTPIKLDYLIRGYTGGLGIALLSIANPILNTELGKDVAEPTLKASKTPFIGGLFQPVEGRGTLDASYERMLDIQQATGTFKRLLESGKKAEAKAFLEEYRNEIMASSVSGAVQQKLGELAKYRRVVLETPKLTTEQKDALLEKIDAQQYEIAKRFISLTDRTTRQ